MRPRGFASIVSLPNWDPSDSDLPIASFPTLRPILLDTMRAIKHHCPVRGRKAARCVDKKSSIITDPGGAIHILEFDDDAPSGPGAAFAVGPASGFSEGLASRRVARRAQIRPIRPIIDISRR